MNTPLHLTLALGALALAACSDGGPSDPSRVTMEVSATTRGADVDPDGYGIVVDGRASTHRIDANGTTRLDVEPGPRSLALTDVAPNCDVAGDNPRTATESTLFEVRCLRFVPVRQGEPSNNVAPFGGASDQRYQQVYAAEALGAGGRIVAIRFLSPGQADVPLATADYHFTLETTARTVSGLSHRMDENVGPGAVTVLDRRIENLRYGDTLAFELDGPFVYEPTTGNLLLDVVISEAVDEGAGTRVFEAVRNSEVVSRRPAYGGTGDGFGLVTVFVLDSVGGL